MRSHVCRFKTLTKCVSNNLQNVHKCLKLQCLQKAYKMCSPILSANSNLSEYQLKQLVKKQVIF